MFHGKNRQALETLIDSSTITPEDQCTPTHTFNAIQSSIKEEEHFWYFREEVMSDFFQQPNEQVHASSNRITTLVTNCKFQDHQPKERIKTMLLLHSIKYHKAKDWIRLQNQSQLTYSVLLQHCKTLEQYCKQFQKVQMKGHVKLTALSATASTTSSVHQDATTISDKTIQCT